MLTILIDADDTLWESNIYYQRCSVQLEDWLVGLGVTRETVAPAIARYEQQVLATYGYSPHGYIEALALSTADLLGQYSITVSDEHLRQARAHGEPMLHPPLALLPDVTETLAVLQQQHRLMLVTKGDQTLQQRKVERSGLAGYFTQVYILDEKDPASYARIITEQALDPDLTFMVGNSPKSDINPAVAAGLRAVLIPHDHTWSAEHEEIAPSPRVAVLARFSELPAYLNRCAAGGST